jgi:hypothetical protein
MTLMKGHQGSAPRNKRFPQGLLAVPARGILPEMSAEENPSTKILLPPGVPLWFTAVKGVVIGLGLGFAVALVFIVLDYRKASSVEAVFVQARTVCLQYRGDNGIWPKDSELPRPGTILADAKLAPLAAALTQCQVPGGWTFVVKSPEGGPAIVFTPAESGRSFERILGVVDGWMDDGKNSAGDLRFDGAQARLRLSVE